MVGLKRRRRVEGWALDISEAEGNLDSGGIRQRLGDSNKLWIACVVVVVVATGIFVKTSGSVSTGPDVIRQPVAAPAEFEDREHRYRQLARGFMNDKRYKESITSVEFLSPGQLQVVVPGTISADEIDYISKMAAETVRNKLNHRVVVLVYVKRQADSSQSLAATTQWDPKKFGFVIRSKGGAERSL